MKKLIIFFLMSRRKDGFRHYKRSYENVKQLEQSRGEVITAITSPGGFFTWRRVWDGPCVERRIQ